MRFIFVWHKREVPMKQHLLRLDRIAGEMNAWLLVIAIGLGMLDLVVLIAKCMPPIPTPPAAVEHQHAAAPPVSSADSRS
jgi:hypothetical protein